MPDGIEKLYYSIGEVSDLLDLEPHVLRYWETQFPSLAPRKNRANRRVYTSEDIDELQRIRHLVRDRRYTLEGARQALEAGDVHAEDGEAVMPVEDLRALRAFLANLLIKLDSIR